MLALLGEQDRSYIEAAIAAVEQRISGGIVVAILPRSQACTHACGMAALLMTVAATLALHVSPRAPYVLQLKIIQVLIFVMAWAAAN